MAAKTEEKIEIRRFTEADAREVSELIIRTLREVNIRDYSAGYIEDLARILGPADIIKRASRNHTYVACGEGRVAGCGAVGPFWDRTDESALFTIFVLPEYQGRGIGRRIVETLENDEFFRRAKRVEVAASITAAPFYLKLGYVYKNGVNGPDEEGLLRMEKTADTKGQGSDRSPVGD